MKVEIHWVNCREAAFLLNLKRTWIFFFLFFFLTALTSTSEDIIATTGKKTTLHNLFCLSLSNCRASHHRQHHDNVQVCPL